MGTRNGYVPAIDGLRAIAVLAVVAYHAGLPVPAGYVGVDVFFVISGYLITRLLHDELRAKGRIDFLDFYARRARRILPALVAVIVVTLAAASAMLPPLEMLQTAKAASASFVFAANVYFGLAPTGYFDGDAHNNPLLHLWSIGVEEQFYLVWPLALLLARRRPALALWVIACTSFLAAEVLIRTGLDQAAFFHTPARAWELAVGGLIAIHRPRVPRWTGPVGAAVVILACAIGLPHFPGTGALPAVAGAAMVIAAAASGHRMPWLEVRPMVWVGLASYSLYLWHWPVMVLGAALPTWVLIAVSIAAASISYRFIEQPFRRRWRRPPLETTTVAAAVVSALALSALLITQRAPGPVTTATSPVPTTSVLPIYSMGCDDWYHSAAVNPCMFGPPDAARTAVMLGDSVALQWFPAVRQLFDKPGWRLVVLTKSACPMVDEPFYYERIGGIFTKCAQWRDDALDWIHDRSPDVVVLGSANNYGFSEAQLRRGTRSVLSRLSKSAGHVVLIRSTPLLTPGGQDSFEEVFLTEKDVAAEFPNVEAVDMNQHVCPGNDCGQNDARTTAYRDNRHISPSFAEALYPTLAQKLGFEP